MKCLCPHCQFVITATTNDLGCQVTCGHCDGLTVVPSTTAAPTVVVGDYVLRRKIRNVQFGAMFSAETIDNDRRPVTVTILSEQYTDDDDAIIHFAELCDELTTLSHPKMCHCWGLHQDDEVIFLLTENADGQNLKQLLKHHQHLPQAQVATIGRDVADALHYLWSEGNTIHGNIKPSNIIVSDTHGAKLDSPALTLGSQALIPNVQHGTPHYLSPEVLLRNPVDFRSDMFALGATLYHAATGTPPFSGGTPEEIAKRRLTQAAAPADAVNTTVDGGFAYVLAQMLAQRPQDRYHAYSVLIRDLQLVADGELPLSYQG